MRTILHLRWIDSNGVVRNAVQIGRVFYDNNAYEDVFVIRQQDDDYVLLKLVGGKEVFVSSRSKVEDVKSDAHNHILFEAYEVEVPKMPWFQVYLYPASDFEVSIPDEDDDYTISVYSISTQ